MEIMIISRKSPYPFFLILIFVCFQIHSKAQPYMEIPVGVILDMGSQVGKTVHSCISMAISDFYTVNSHYKTRIILHNRDTHGEPLHAVSAALDLLEKAKVQVILGSQSSAEAKFLGVLGDQARVPILSLSPIPSSNRHLYFLQITQDETTQVKAIASMVLSYGWKNVIVIFEDNDNGRDMATFIATSFQEKSITITYMCHISTFSSNEVLQGELHKLSNMQTKQYIVHASHSLASHLFPNAKNLGMMDAGYKWIVTSKTMNFLNFMGDEVIASMQGVVGFKSHIPQSRNLHNFTLKCRKEYHEMDINVYAILAYDGVSALAMAVEKTKSVLELKTEDLAISGSTEWGRTLLDQMLRISFDGLSGNFKFMNTAQVLQIINVIGKEEVKVGFWTTNAAFTKTIGKLSSFPDDVLKSIMWPGGILNNPTRMMLPVSNKLLRIGIPLNTRTGPLFNIEYNATSNSTLVSGFCSDVFKAAFAGLGTSVDFEFIPFITIDEEHKLGGADYNDLIDQVHAGKFDAAMGDITITANRSMYVDFTMPFTATGLAALIRNADASMWIFMKPLSPDLWIVSACFFILLGFVIWILEHRTNDEFQGSLVQQIGVTLWFAFSTLVYAHRQKLESNLSRFVVTVWLFVVLVLVSSYTATLSSLLTVEQIQLSSKRNIIGYQSGSPIQGVIVRNFHFNDTRMRPYDTIAEIAEALSFKSSIYRVDAVIEEIPYVKEFLEHYPSGYSMVKSEDITNGFGFVFPKGSPWTHEISSQIARLREEGTLLELENRWFGKQSDPQSQSESQSQKILNFEGLSGLFLISAVSMAAALSLFTIYYTHEKVHSTYANAMLALARGKLAFNLGFLLPERTTAVE